MLKDWFRKKQSQPDPTLAAVEPVRIGGPPELEFLFIEVSPADIQRALDGWRWIAWDGLVAVAVSGFGEIFFRDANGSIQQLDMIEGRVKKVADSLASFTARLQEPEGRDDLLLGGLILAARSRGLLLNAGECYDFRIPPVLGGEMSADAMEIMSFVVKAHIAGQVHEQVKDLPPGTRINNVTLSG